MLHRTLNQTTPLFHAGRWVASRVAPRSFATRPSAPRPGLAPQRLPSARRRREQVLARSGLGSILLRECRHSPGLRW